MYQERPHAGEGEQRAAQILLRERDGTVDEGQDWGGRQYKRCPGSDRSDWKLESSKADQTANGRTRVI
eukprot:1836474-Pleurochrysis_carterae.AAC.1